MAAGALIGAGAGLSALGLGLGIAGLMQKKKNLSKRFLEDMERRNMQAAADAASGIDNPYQRARAQSDALQEQRLASAPVISALRMEDARAKQQRKQAIFGALGSAFSGAGAQLVTAGAGQNAAAGAAGGASAGLTQGQQQTGVAGGAPSGLNLGNWGSQLQPPNVGEGVGGAQAPLATPMPTAAPTGAVSEQQALSLSAQEEERRRIAEQIGNPQPWGFLGLAPFYANNPYLSGGQ